MSGPTVRRDQLFARYQYADGSLSSSVIPRFGVIQGTTGRRCRDCAMASSACAQCVGQSMPKSPCCDVTRSSGSHDHTRMVETVFYPSFKFPARVGAAIFDCCQQSGRSCPELLLGLDDLFAVCRRVNHALQWWPCLGLASVARRLGGQAAASGLSISCTISLGFSWSLRSGSTAPS